MNKQAISNALKALQKTVKKHSPEILTGIGIAGMTAAAVMAVKATPKALRMVDEKEIRDGKRLTTGEIVKTYALCERALLYDWCICNGEYSLREYAGKLMPMFLQSIRAE